MVYCTYCAADKIKQKMLVPAIDRYISERINGVAELAEMNNVQFFILSGKFGMLSKEQAIPYYDHLLSIHEVEQHAVLVAEQIAQYSIEQIRFFSRPVTLDPNIKPYLECIKLACKLINVKLDLVWLENDDLGAVLINSTPDGPSL